MDTGARRELEILNTIAEGRPLSQRALAGRLGVALGLANLYLKRLARKGYIKATTIPPNRIRYLLTPRGLAEKSRLTYAYMRHSLRLYREARHSIREILAPVCGERSARIAIFGTGEAAELSYLTLKELGLEPVMVIGEHDGGRFLALAVRSVSSVPPDEYDWMIVSTLDPPDTTVGELERRGVPRDKMILLRGVAAPVPEDDGREAG